MRAWNDLGVGPSPWCGCKGDTLGCCACVFRRRGWGWGVGVEMYLGWLSGTVWDVDLCIAQCSFGYVIALNAQYTHDANIWTDRQVLR